MFLHDYAKDCNRLFGLTPKIPQNSRNPHGCQQAPPARCHTESIFNYWFYKTAERPTDNAADDAKLRPSLCQGNAGAD